jgi:hypothetical protein
MSSLASLRRRADRLQAQLVELQARKQFYAGTANKTSLPGADNWPAFAAQTYIRTSGTIMPFVPYKYEVDLIRTIHNSKNTIVLKSRQMGASESVASYLSCRAATEPGFAAIIISKTQNDSSDLGRRVRYMLNSIAGQNFRYDSDSNTVVSIKGGGTLYFLPGSPRAARGIPSGSVLWIDEAAFVDGAEEIYRAATPALSMLGDQAKTIITSTPDTEAGWFGGLWHHGTPSDWYDNVAAAVANPPEGERLIEELNHRLLTIQDDWARVAVHWTQHPVYNADPDWATKTREKRRLTQKAFDAEFNLSFGSTDTQLYPTALVKRAARGAFEECGRMRRTYVMGIDPNGGGNDYFVALVLDITEKPYTVVQMYRENGRSTEYSLRHVKQLIEDFLPQRITVEKQAMGSVVAEALQAVVPEYVIETFSTSRPSKNVATDRVLYLLEHDHLIFPEGVIGDELRAFQVLEGGKREAAPGRHDDTVMALSFACSLTPEVETSAVLFANL